MSTPTLSFTGFVTAQGRMKLDDRDGLMRYLSTLAGKAIELTVKRRKSQRSLDQNRWLWGVALPLIAEHCGYDHHEHEALHYELLAKRFGTKQVESRVPGSPALVVPAITSSELSVDEFSDYMDWLCRFAATELGVVIPLPSERSAA